MKRHLPDPRQLRTELQVEEIMIEWRQRAVAGNEGKPRCRHQQQSGIALLYSLAIALDGHTESIASLWADGREIAARTKSISSANLSVKSNGNAAFALHMNAASWRHPDHYDANLQQTGSGSVKMLRIKLLG
jgi:hypothetical protein